jgi:S1-C subfamily serine protease
VIKVPPDSAAAVAGLERLDVIQTINGQAVRNAKQALQVMKNAQGKRFELQVWRKGDSRSLVVDESKSR